MPSKKVLPSVWSQYIACFAPKVQFQGAATTLLSYSPPMHLLAKRGVATFLVLVLPVIWQR